MQLEDVQCIHQQKVPGRDQNKDMMWLMRRLYVIDESCELKYQKARI
uniref:Uncharacterized protein n=1 Tax=Anguilla anguilla TaxID=7936 RepID=A0A0E9RB61_ANGAN